MTAILGFRSILFSAVVAGVFSAVVCALLLNDGANRLSKVPLEHLEFKKLRKEYVAQPNES